jgi:LacI family transcriptional regulator, repressor for deo operon, udp, cdd, tsx, nupC, and nupG
VQATIETSTYQILNQLFEEGHTRIGHIQGPMHFPSMAERIQGYTNAYKTHKKKTDPTLQVTTDLSKEGTIKAMQKLMALKKPPTAVLCFNDYVAFDAIQAARKHYGKSLNIEFVSYANLPVGHYMDYSLKASIEQFPYMQGEKAMELLLQRITDPENPPVEKRIYINSEIVMHV